MANASRKSPRNAASIPYPKPGPAGGQLIRQVIAMLKAQGLAPPLAVAKGSHILIAVSGGADSLALALLLARYGRRVAARQQIRLVHVNHGWRGAESDSDEQFVRDFAKRHKLKIDVVRLAPPAHETRDSWEDVARKARKQVFEKLAAKHQAWVLTAHQADDLAETVLWRLLTGTGETHGGGIAARHGVELRPFLKIRKEALREFLLEEGQPWREDATNRDPRFLRARMRLELMPAVEAIFPRAVEHLVKLAFRAQAQSAQLCQPNARLREGLGALFSSAGISPRRSHWEWIRDGQESPGRQSAKKAQVDLPRGWKLIREAGRNGVPERWTLEKSKLLE
ncbi:MAG: tRNA lysidine(34) synthetase TilS [Oligoflexia bacterium]|nr:tRNA lysidine(34) synthetase TilS [Oligoflexia bacterium]